MHEQDHEVDHVVPRQQVAETCTEGKHNLICGFHHFTLLLICGNIGQTNCYTLLIYHVAGLAGFKLSDSAQVLFLRDSLDVFKELRCAGLSPQGRDQASAMRRSPR